MTDECTDVYSTGELHDVHPVVSEKHCDIVNFHVTQVVGGKTHRKLYDSFPKCRFPFLAPSDMEPPE